MSDVRSDNLITLKTPSLTVLGSEPVPGEIFRDLLKAAWIPTQRVPRPEIHLMNDIDLPGVQAHLKKADYIFLAETSIVETQHGHTYEYKDIEVTLPFEIYTLAGRQRLYDLWAVLKRIFYTYQHVIRPYQQLHVGNFQEIVRDKQGFWVATATMRAESKAVPVITGISSGFETPAQPQAGAHAAEFQPQEASTLEEPEEPDLPDYNEL
ncbi:hypothetical protein LCGC14_2521850 [marine sediment metagenome]|uniref:Uncharacterized protein n=1 Tax=marine sediment metagenome TaxID=412755 RepID=A0A0F9AW65_9ZZZZ